MFSVLIKYLDLEVFIDVKMIEGKVIGVNVLVKLDDVFMLVVVEGRKYI